MNDGEWVVAFDTDRIKDYLFATNRLKDIRGASKLLDELNQTRTKRVVLETCPDADTVYAAGGGALFLVPSEVDAGQVIEAVEKLYRQETVVASITGACLPLAPATREQGFGRRVQDLGFLLRRNKARKAEMPTMPVIPALHLCDSCGRHPAACHRRDEEGQDVLLCRACAIKRDHAPGDRPREPSDFNELGELSQPPGYLGFIHADGNLMGNKLEQLASEEDYRHFATGVIELMEHARDTATDQFGLRQGKRPYIELLLGGDDLLLVTAADLALPVALALARIFEEGSEEKTRQHLTLSVGVVLAHASYPIAELHRLSADRLQNAKRCSFEKEDYATGAVDFEVVTSAAGFEDGKRPYRNKRPYLLDELDELLGHAKQLQAFPSSQLQAMYESLYGPKMIATLTSLVALARARLEQRQALWKFFHWSGSLQENRLPPWSKPGDLPETALGDLVEILPFVSERR